MEKGLTNDWKDVIRNKKVILYITSIASMLNGKERHIDKIESVIETFRQQEDVVLWWRPHPLELSTLESMHPRLLERYKNIQEKFSRSASVIFDTSGDLHRAITISDAYFGDWSSVIQVYEKTEKPILIQSDETYGNNIELNIFDFEISDQYVWAILLEYNILFKFKLKDGDLDELIYINKDNVVERNTYSNIALVEDEVLLIPGLGNEICVYDINTKNKNCINLGKRTKRAKYGCVYQKNKQLYLLPWAESKIVCLTRGVDGKYRTQVEIEADEELLIDRSADVDNEHIYAVKKKGNVIYKYDTYRKEINYLKTNQENASYMGILKYGENLVMPDFKNNVVILWNEKSKIETIPIPMQDSNKYFSDFAQMIKIDEGILLFPNKKGYILKIDIKNKKIENYKLIQEKYGYAKVKKIDGKIYAYAKHANKLIIINDTNEEVSEVQLNMDHATIKDILMSHKAKFYESEKDSLTINNYISYVRELKITEKNKPVFRNIGNDIHAAIVR